DGRGQELNFEKDFVCDTCILTFVILSMEGRFDVPDTINVLFTSYKAQHI
ncbi:hypothetical protein ABZP36_033328, partial [Zizania latifolia]